MPQRCKVCAHPSRSQIEGMVLESVAYRRIAMQFGLSEAAVGRHVRNHMASVLEAAEEDRTRQLLDKVQELQDRTLLILSGAEMHDHALALRAVREARQNLRLLADLSERQELSERISALEAEL